MYHIFKSIEWTKYLSLHRKNREEELQVSSLTWNKQNFFFKHWKHHTVPLKSEKHSRMTTKPHCNISPSWWRHQKETFSALLAFCAGNSLVTGEFPAQGPVTRSFDVFFDLSLNKWLTKQSWGWWLETPSHPLWQHCNVCHIQGQQTYLQWRQCKDHPQIQLHATLQTLHHLSTIPYHNVGWRLDHFNFDINHRNVFVNYILEMTMTFPKSWSYCGWPLHATNHLTVTEHQLIIFCFTAKV